MTFRKLSNTEIKQTLKDNRYSQVYVSKHIGCRESQLSKYLNGWENLPEKHLINLFDFLLNFSLIKEDS